MACISDTDRENKLLVARAEDAVRLSELRHVPRFVGFLDERQQGLLRKRFGDDPHIGFFGGYPAAQRVFFGAFDGEPDPDAFPVVSLHFRYREQAALSHRDFLGTFMAGGIRRETVGDILCRPGSTVVLVDAEVHTS